MALRTISGMGISQEFLNDLHVEYLGFTGDVNLHWFTDLDTLTGLVVKAIDLTPDILREKVEARRRVFGAGDAVARVGGYHL